MISKNSYWIFRALPGRRRGGGGLGDTFTTTNAASFGLGGVFGGGKPRSAGIKIGGGTDPMIGKWILRYQTAVYAKNEPNTLKKKNVRIIFFMYY